MLFIINTLARLYFSPSFSPVFPCTTPFKPDPAYRGFRPSLIVRERPNSYQDRAGQVMRGGRGCGLGPSPEGRIKLNRADGGVCPCQRDPLPVTCLRFSDKTNPRL